MRVRFAYVAAVVALSTVALAQDRAPRGTATTTINGKKVDVEFGRPSLKGRSIDDLTRQLPGDRMWRAGVDQVTTLTTETDLMIGGKKVPAGEYTVYIHCPETGDWSLAINSDQGVGLGQIWSQAPPEMAKAPWPHLDYEKEIGSKEIARATMKKAAVASPVELFTIALAPAKTGATMTLSWGDRSWTVDLTPAK